jgi:hypothetical protein
VGFEVGGEVFSPFSQTFAVVSAEVDQSVWDKRAARSDMRCFYDFGCSWDVSAREDLSLALAVIPMFVFGLGGAHWHSHISG